MNKIFDLQRFGNLAKWDILTNKKFYIRIVIGLTIALAFIFCFHTWINSQGSSRIASGYHLDSLAGSGSAEERIGVGSASDYEQDGDGTIWGQ